jgi:hypothetical protein
MAQFARVTTLGWRQGDDAAAQARVGGSGWYQVESGSGALTLAPPLLTNAQTFYAPSVSLGAPQILAPGLLTNAQTFYTPSVALRGVTAAYVLANTAPVDGNVAGAMYEVAGLVDPSDYMTYATVSGPTPGGGVLEAGIAGDFEYTGDEPAIWVIQIKINGVDYFETTTIYLYEQALLLQPSLLTNGQTFFAPTVTRGAASVQNLAPALFTNQQAFYRPTITGGTPPPSPPPGKRNGLAIGLRIGL